MQDSHAISASKSRRWWQLDQAVHFPRLERGDHRIGDDGRRDPVHHQADDTRRPSRSAPLQVDQDENVARKQQRVLITLEPRMVR